MELKFRVNNFSRIRKSLKENDARFLCRRKEIYIYLKDGNKLTRYQGKYFYVTIRKKNSMFLLKKRKITKKEHQFLISRGIKKILNNSRLIYKIGSTEISTNEMEVGKFVILDGGRNIQFAKKLGLRNRITKPFSEL